MQGLDSVFICMYKYENTPIACMFERCLYFNVNALSREVNRRWETAFAPLGISPAQGYLLRLVLGRPGLMPGEIAQELHLAPSTVTRLVDGLEARGMLERRAAQSNDERQVAVHPTRASEALREKLDGTGDALYREMLRRLGERTVKTLVTDLRSAKIVLAGR